MISFNPGGGIVMVTVVIVLNLLIATGCLSVAWQVWKLRSALSNAADALLSAERATHRVLRGAPQGIGKGETGVYHLRQKYQLLEVKLLRVQQILKLLGVGQLVWQRYGKKLPLLKQAERAVPKTGLGQSKSRFLGKK